MHTSTPRGKISRVLCGCQPSGGGDARVQVRVQEREVREEDYHPVLCGCRGRCGPTVDGQWVPVRKGFGTVIADEVESGSNNNDE